jgi:phosphoglycolate phosphatase
MPDNFQYIIFDLDGTLTDSFEGIKNSILYALRGLGITEDHPEELISFVGPPLIDSMKNRYDMNSSMANEAVRLYREYFSEKGVYENRLYDGAKDLLEGLSQAGKSIYLATSKPDRYVGVILEYFKIDHYFDGISAANIDRNILHKTDVLGELFRNHSEINKSVSVMIGDRKYDLSAANHHGIKAIGVSWGFGSREELLKEEPCQIADSIEELHTFLMN